ncbi:probable helicase senataxin [Saccopteryx leptura]|uniref:probable helicase senataxin n=1 Tax=Saccopteryx leptura TaxID=249018 RepID=UPI00339C7FFA
MSTCCWCTPGGASTAVFLQRYVARTHSSQFQTANEDLCYCLECVIEYHRARDQLPFLHEVLWELETLRLINHFEKSMSAEIEDDELYIVDNNGEAQLFDFTGQDFENKLRVPLLEILKYPYLLLHERVNELCVEALCRMEQANCSFQVFEKQPGIYLFLVHPNEMVRRWAILTTKGLGRVDRDDYYDLQEVLTCLFKVIELRLLENPDIDTYSVLEKGKLIILLPHMYDAASYKNYWLGICMLLTILEEQAMDSLLLGSGRQNDFVQSILCTMKQPAGDSEDPFWPALHCFMVILDRLGSKVWGQLTDPIEAFQTIINNASYNREIQAIRSSSARTKLEPESYLDDMATCSQIVYNYNPEKTKKDSGWRSAICPDYCPNMYEEMETLASVLQSDIGQDMRVHNSTFLWFIPFVQSLMDLKDLGVAYIAAVIHHLHSQVKDVLNHPVVMCDKVTEFFLLILVSVIELHRSKKCLHLLWVSSQQWVEAIVNCAKLPTSAFTRSSEKSPGSGLKGTAVVTSLSLHPVPSNSVQLACVQLIRSLLKEGYQLGEQTLCKRFWDKLNLFLRGNLSLGWQLTCQETQELQTCLKEIIKNIKSKIPQYTVLVEPAPSCKLSLASCKEEGGQVGKTYEKDLHCLESSSPAFSKEPVKANVYQVRKSRTLSRASSGEECNEASYIKGVKQEDQLSAKSCFSQSCQNPFSERAHGQGQVCTRQQKSGKDRSSSATQNCTSRPGPERGCERGRSRSAHVLTDSDADSPETGPASGEDFSFLKGGDLGRASRAKPEVCRSEIYARLSRVIKKEHRPSCQGGPPVKSEGSPAGAGAEGFCSRGGQKVDRSTPPLSLDPHDTLDNKNGEQKFHNSSLLKKKQLKNEEIDAFSSDENDCQIQECVDDKGLISFSEMINFMHRPFPFKEPVPLLESRDKEISKSTHQGSSDLSEQAPSLSPQSDTLTDSQIDRDLHKLSLIAQASVSKFPSHSTPESSPQLQRKVKDKRNFRANQNNVRETCHGQVIIISDSDDDGDERIVDFERDIKEEKTCIKKECPEPRTSVAGPDVETKLPEEAKPEFPLECEDLDSQLFEFESQHEMFSAWQDQRPENKSPLQGDEEDSCLIHAADTTNDWGYITDYPMNEEVTRRKTEDIERAEPQPSSSVEEFCEVRVKKPRRKQFEKRGAEDPLSPSSSVRNEVLAENHLSVPDVRTSPRLGVQSTTPASLKTFSPKPRSTSKPARRVPVSKTPKTHLDTKKGQNKSLNYVSCRTTPAIVPPNKIHRCPEPTSTVEKLGLKKGRRKAFDLSQRSLDCIDQLRDHGKSVGVIDTRKKTKSFSPQTRFVKNKKMLGSPDLQLQRRARPKSQRSRQRQNDCESAAATGARPCATQSAAVFTAAPERSGDSRRGATGASADSKGHQAVKCASPEQAPVKAKRVSQEAGDNSLLSQCDPPGLSGKMPTSETMVSASEDPLGGGDLAGHHLEAATLKKGEPDSDSDMEEDAIFLTQHDPEDMDLCSQMQNGSEKPIEVVQGKESVLVEDRWGSRPQPESGSRTRCQYEGCVETVRTRGGHCSKHSEAKAADEGVFRKPGLPPSKPSRPSTTKIFTSSSTSRMAHLSRSLESAAARPALRNRPSAGRAVWKAAHPTSPVFPKPPLGEVKSLGNVPPSPAPDRPSRQAYTFPDAESRPFFSSPVSMLLSQQSLSDTFVKEVLSWTYDMFVKFAQCGPPASLCQNISRPVPVRFQDCEDYFNVFLPLIILNTFETLAQEWIGSPNKERTYQLHLRKFPAEYKKFWEFVVFLEECELSKQLHPKENDLVFLLFERPNGEKRDIEGRSVQGSSEYYCAYIHKFRRTSVMHNGKYECSLFIQTQDDLPVNLNEFVKCIVISSLVTTQRKLKAMSLLSGRNQLARAILNPNPMDFCTKDLLTTTSERIDAYLRDFNEDQKKAIETAYAMVKHSPAVAKICLIHGPPGTGKSKTIVGLLYRLLTERRGLAAENLNAKIKQNRVLVCAPSNAAVDELMKKIIIEFKERCKDKRNPLGNCGDINLVRLGPEKSINNEVLKFSLDNQVNHRMKKDLPSHVQEMHRRKEYLDRQLDDLSRQRALCRVGREAQRQELDEKIAQVSEERQELASKIKEVQGRPQKTQSIIILESHVICCTLSTSGGLLLESAFRGQGRVPFSCVIVDEAGQSCEVETLTPLIHRCNKLVLVGDPKQLPPTVISMKAQEYGYDQSMMGRFCKLLEENVEHNVSSRLPVLQLTVQYRMHPDICLFPSNYIYSRSLRTSRLTETTRCASDWPFQPYLVFDVGDGSERRSNDSYVNFQEIKMVIELIKLLKDRRKDFTSRNIGIITHYKAQKMMIQKELDEEFEGNGPAEVDTVDAFQGRQKDCIIVTCVRANTVQGSIGFLASLQRLNVTITRAKYSLFILGHLRTLMDNQHWNCLIQDAQRRGAIIKTYDKTYKHDAAKILKLKPVLQRSLTHPPAMAPGALGTQGGPPSSMDSESVRTASAASLGPVPPDGRDAAVTITAMDPERPPGKDQPRDPRLLRRMGVSVEAKGQCLWDPAPLSPQQAGATPPSGEPGLPVSPPALGSPVEPSTATGSSHRPHVPCDPPAAGADATPRSCGQAGAHSHQRETKASSSRNQETHSSAPCHTKRNSGWDAGRPEDSSSKKRKL